MLQDPSAPPPPAPPPSAPPAPSGPVWGAPPPPPEQGGAGGELPPPPGPPPGGYGPPPGGGWPPPPGGGFGGFPPGGPGGPTRPPEEPPLPAPFAERGRKGLLRSFVETWKLVAIEPARFFRRVRPDQTGSAVLFGVIAYAIGTALQALYTAVSGASTFAALERVADRLPPEQAELLRSLGEGASGGGLIVAEVLLAPVLGFVLLYLSAGILHLLLVLFRGAHRGFEATLTAVGYAFGLYLLLAIPGCGGLVAGIWVLVALVIGLGEIHRCGTGRSAAAVLAPVLLVCLCCCGAAGLMGAGGILKALGETARSSQTTTL
jgi:hypothetical protein